MTTRIEMLNADCERCGKHSERLIPFNLVETISYHGREINKPWLCSRCLRIEKEKYWDARPAL